MFLRPWARVTSIKDAPRFGTLMPELAPRRFKCSLNPHAAAHGLACACVATVGLNCVPAAWHVAPKIHTQVLAGVQQHGVAPGARVMMDMEEEAAQMSLETGLYVTWRSRNGTDCTRVGPRSKCFCGHTYSDHQFATRKAAYPTCKACTCRAFEFIPQR